MTSAFTQTSTLTQASSFAMTSTFRLRFPSPEINYAATGPNVVSALRMRRSDFAFDLERPVPFLALGRILNEALGITERFGRGTPSPHRLYPLECYVLVLTVERVQAGLYRYDPADHALVSVPAASPPRAFLERALQNKGVARTAAVHVFLAASLDVARGRLGDDADRLILLEAGHIAQSMLLLAVNEGIASCSIGVFDSTAVDAYLGVDRPAVSVVHSAAFGYAKTGPA